MKSTKSKENKRGLDSRRNLDIGKASSGKSWFFGIGINEYKSHPNLINARKDIEDVMTMLKERYDVSESYTLYDTKATRKNIVEYLQDLQMKIDKKDKLIIYYSGHGYMTPGNRGFWVPHDAEGTRQYTLLSNSDIHNFIEDMEAKHILLISDSCFSSTLIRSNYEEKALEVLERRRSRWIIASGRNWVPDGKSGLNSPFTSSVLQVLQENKIEGINTWLFYIEVHKLTCQKTDQEPGAGPLLGTSHDGGQYIFRLRTINNRWKIIQELVENTKTEIDFKIAMIDEYTDQEPESEDIEEALELGERLEQKKEFLLAQDSLFRLKKFCRTATLYQKEARILLKKLQVAYDQNKKSKRPSHISPKSYNALSPRLHPRANGNPLSNSNYSFFIDERDGQKYRTIEFNGLIWMTENLNFKLEEGSHLYDNKMEHQEKFGYLYQLEATNDACPSGWRLPTDEEWRNLLIYFGGYFDAEYSKFRGDAVKSYKQLIFGGRSGFSAVHGGYRSYNGEYHFFGKIGYYWSGTSSNDQDYVFYTFNHADRIVSRSTKSKGRYFSCRCVKDLGA